jgi:hypothetical protein
MRTFSFKSDDLEIVIPAKAGIQGQSLVNGFRWLESRRRGLPDSKSLSFVSAKESNQRKTAPGSSALAGYPALLTAAGHSQNSGSNNGSPNRQRSGSPSNIARGQLPPLLRCSATHTGFVVCDERGYGWQREHSAPSYRRRLPRHARLV